MRIPSATALHRLLTACLVSVGHTGRAAQAEQHAAACKAPPGGGQNHGHFVTAEQDAFHASLSPFLLSFPSRQLTAVLDSP